MYFLILFTYIFFCNVKRWIFTVTCGILHRDRKEELICRIKGKSTIIMVK